MRTASHEIQTIRLKKQKITLVKNHPTYTTPHKSRHSKTKKPEAICYRLNNHLYKYCNLVNSSF